MNYRNTFGISTRNLLMINLSFCRSILRDLVRGLSDDLLSCYEKLLTRYKQNKDVINQNRALQFIFDFKFLSSVFGDRSKAEVGYFRRKTI